MTYRYTTVKLKSIHNISKQINMTKIVAFWKPKEQFGYFSNWFISPMIDENGTRYEHVEMFMMAGKAKLFNDKFMLEQILKTTSPMRCRALGRKVTNFDERTWRREARNIVKQGLRLKFNDPTLRRYLLETGDAILVEASPSDKIWGVGMTADNPDITDSTKWKGTNWLGQCLMDVREEVKQNID